MNRDVLFGFLRTSPFGGSLVQSQVDGVNAILDECEKQGVTSPQFIAYILATAYHETGATFKPLEENLKYSAAGIEKTFGKRLRAAGYTAKQIAALAGKPQALANAVYGGRNGNTAAGDGWKYRGRGFVQLTFKDNYAKYGLADKPDTAGRVRIAAFVLVDGMASGKFTDKRLSHYLRDGVFDAVGARAIVNGKDKASLIATHYVAFLGAIASASQEHVANKTIEEVDELANDAAKPDDLKGPVTPVSALMTTAISGGAVSSLFAALTNPYALAGFALCVVAGGIYAYMRYTGKLKEYRA